MGISHRTKAVIVAMAIFLMCLVLFWKQSVGAEAAQITDGSNVTALHQIIFSLPENPGSNFEYSVNSFRDNTNCCRLWSGGPPA
jgi:hypothetical protein